MKKNYSLNKLKAVLYILLALAGLGLCLFFQFKDPNAMMLVELINYLGMALTFYFAVIFTMDLFSGKPSISLGEEGIFLNYGYYKSITLPWSEVTEIEKSKFLVWVKVDDVDSYLAKLPMITRLIVRSNKKRYDTIFVLRGFLIDTKADTLYADIEEAMSQYKR